MFIPMPMLGDAIFWKGTLKNNGHRGRSPLVVQRQLAPIHENDHRLRHQHRGLVDRRRRVLHAPLLTGLDPKNVQRDGRTEQDRGNHGDLNCDDPTGND